MPMIVFIECMVLRDAAQTAVDIANTVETSDPAEGRHYELTGPVRLPNENFQYEVYASEGGVEIDASTADLQRVRQMFAEVDAVQIVTAELRAGW